MTVSLPGEKADEHAFLDSVEGEISFFRSIMRARPVGMHRHFHVIAVRNFISKDTGRLVHIDTIWEKLKKSYDLDALDAIVCYSFLNGILQTEFAMFFLLYAHRILNQKATSLLNLTARRRYLLVHLLLTKTWLLTLSFEKNSRYHLMKNLKLSSPNVVCELLYLLPHHRQPRPFPSHLHR